MEGSHDPLQFRRSLTVQIVTWTSGQMAVDHPSLGLINLVKWLTKLRNMFLDHWLIVKGYNSGTSRWKRWIGNLWAKRRCFPALSKLLLSPNLTCSPTWKPPTLVLFFLMEALSHRRYWLDHWALEIDSTSHLGGTGGWRQGWVEVGVVAGGTRPSKILITWLVPLATDPHP